MDYDLVILYSAFCFLGAILPGPTSFLALSLGLKGKYRLIFFASLGAAIADFLIIFSIGLGFEKIITKYPVVFEIIRVSGFLYLLFIALMIWRSTSKITATEQIEFSISQLMLKGFLTSLSNPKVLVFFIAVLPQFVNIKYEILPQYIILGVISSIIDILSMGLYGVLTIRLLHILKDPKRIEFLNKFSAICMVLIAIFLIIR